MTRFSSEQIAALKTLLTDFFDLNELTQLTRERLGETLANVVDVRQDFTAVAFDLLTAVERRGWAEEFVRAVYERRPHVPAVAAFCRAHADFVFRPRTANADLVADVSGGLTAVAGRVAGDAGGVRAVLTDEPARVLADLGARFARLHRYKVLHDCLHNIQFKYVRLIGRDLGEFVAKPALAGPLRILLREAGGDLKGALDAADGLESQDAERLWVRTGARAIDEVQKAVAAKDPPAAAHWFRALDGLLRVQPTRVNLLLAEQLKDLGLDRLRQTLAALGAADDPGAPLPRAAAALGALTPRLNRLVGDHKQWQLVDNALRQMKTGLDLGSPPAVEAPSWAEAAAALARLLDADRAADWSRELRGLSDALTAAFATDDPAVVRPAFDDLHFQAMWAFYTVDKELKALSGDLDKLGAVLDGILKEVARAAR